MALDIHLTSSYKTDLKKYKNNKRVMSRLKTALDLLANEKELPLDYDDHIYVGGYRKYKNVRDCHIIPDCVLLYTKSSNMIVLIRLGNHGSILENLNMLRIKEDTACVASKTSYIDEDGLDKNGIYYFGDKPKLPVNWKDYKKDDNKKYGLKEGNTMKLRINESIADENGMFMQMDDAMDGLIGNVGDDDIDEVVKYYSTISGKLGKKDKFSDIVCYFCSDYADVCDPIDTSKIYFDFKPVYKNGKYDSYVSSKYGDKFVIDHFNDNFMFTVYATNEDVINRLIDDISNEYDNL